MAKAEKEKENRHTNINTTTKKVYGGGRGEGGRGPKSQTNPPSSRPQIHISSETTAKTHLKSIRSGVDGRIGGPRAHHNIVTLIGYVGRIYNATGPKQFHQDRVFTHRLDVHAHNSWSTKYTLNNTINGAITCHMPHAHTHTRTHTHLCANIRTANQPMMAQLTEQNKATAFNMM